MSNSTSNTQSAYPNDIEYLLERQAECQSALKAIEMRGSSGESVGKLKGKLEAYGEMIAFLQKKASTESV